MEAEDGLRRSSSTRRNTGKRRPQSSPNSEHPDTPQRGQHTSRTHAQSRTARIWAVQVVRCLLDWRSAGIKMHHTAYCKTHCHEPGVSRRHHILVRHGHLPPNLTCNTQPERPSDSQSRIKCVLSVKNKIYSVYSSGRPFGLQLFALMHSGPHQSLATPLTRLHLALAFHMTAHGFWETSYNQHGREAISAGQARRHGRPCVDKGLGGGVLTGLRREWLGL